MNSSRRSFLAGASAFTVIRPELVRGSGKAMLRAGLVGCGGRGTQAAIEFLTGNENVELVALGDLFPAKIQRTLAEVRNGAKYQAIQNKIKVDVEHQFTGFDAYRKILESDIDVILLCTPPVYRPEHFEAAVEARKHIFAEKPFGVDPPGVRRILAAARRAEEVRLTVMAGTQRRSAPNYVGTIRKIQDGVIGEIVAAYAYWCGTAIVQEPVRPADMKELEYQTRNWYSFRWLSGDHVVEQHVHNIDVINWTMNAHPVRAVSSGSVAWRGKLAGNNYDHFSTDFEYANGAHMASYCRQYPTGSASRVEELVVGTKGRSNCCDMAEKGRVPATTQEHIDMVNSIRGDGPYMNRGMAVAESTLTAIMAREAAYSGRKITWDEILSSQLDITPKRFDLDMEIEVSRPPVPGTYKFV